MTLRPIKNWFETMSPKERIILLGVAWITVILWGSMLLASARKLNTDYKLSVQKLATQQKSLDQRQSVEKQINTYSKIFQTPIEGPALIKKINGYAQEAGLPQNQLNINSNKRTTGSKDSVFDINSATINFNRIPFLELVDFTQKIHNDRPYLMISDITITPGTLNPTLVDGNMRVDSLEPKPGAFDVNSPTNSSSVKPH